MATAFDEDLAVALLVVADEFGVAAAQIAGLFAFAIEGLDQLKSVSPSSPSVLVHPTRRKCNDRADRGTA